MKKYFAVIALVLVGVFSFGGIAFADVFTKGPPEANNGEGWQYSQ